MSHRKQAAHSPNEGRRPDAEARRPDDRAPTLEALGLTQGGLIALAGAGGKSTLAHRLTREGASRGLRTIVTATTRLGATAAGAAAVTLEDAAASDADQSIASLLDRHGCVAVTGARERPDRWAGLPAQRVDALASLCDLLVVETDGARGRLLKLPAEHEPVVPGATTLLLVVAGLDVLGRPLDPAHVHRFERVLECLSRSLGREPGELIDADALAAVLLDAGGYLARVPPGAGVAVFLNAHDAADATHAADAERLAELLLERYDVVAAGSAQTGVARTWRRA